MELCVPVIVENLRIKKLAWFIETPEFLFFSIIKKETGKFNVEYS